MIETNILLLTAASIGFVHTIIGPDHYLPFIMISRARSWSFQKTIFITLLCGIGHVLGSVILGLVGIMFGVAVGLLDEIESVRGNFAGWLLIGFGVAYAAWGLRLGLRAKEHVHDHQHEDEDHHHSHHHLGKHFHIHGDVKTITPWALFVIFILGPCEPLIPVLMYPAAQGDWWALAGVTFVFGAVTIATMTIIVMISYKRLVNFNLGFLEKYTHALAGLIIAISGIAI
ncbi:MAG: sulfite exporter TauE/SafE family protein, partial [Candidatus Marinimicrobia bacterium]|nr:sulfite exporter TauE/SafE family protein [Candidatus Neomarinimicrobiota bacterium]